MKKQTDKRTVVHISQNEQIKKASKGRKDKERKKNAAVAVVIIIILLAVAVFAAAALLKVGSIEVANNNGRYTDDRIVEIAGISNESSLLMLREEKIEDAVCLALPYIRTVELVRTLPDHVQLQVQYAEPAFAVDCGQLWLILSEEGKVLETTQIEPSGITQLKGVLVSEYTVGKSAVFENALYFDHAADIYKSAGEKSVGSLNTLQIDQSGYVTLNIENRFYVQSGSVHVLLEEMDVLRQVILERKDRTTAFTFTLAADGSITISHKDGAVEEETTEAFKDPYVNMDSELVGGEAQASTLEDASDDGALTDHTAVDTTVADSDTLG